MIEIDEATLAKVKEYAAGAFAGFTVEGTTILPIRHKRVSVPYLPRPTDDEPWPRYRDYTLDVPANWLERLKRRRAPRWLRGLWPVRTRQVVKTRPIFFEYRTIVAEPHTLSDGTIIDMGYLNFGAGYVSDILAVRVAA